MLFCPNVLRMVAYVNFWVNLHIPPPKHVPLFTRKIVGSYTRAFTVRSSSEFEFLSIASKFKHSFFAAILVK